MSSKPTGTHGITAVRPTTLHMKGLTMQLNRDFRERQGEGWERPDAMDQRFNPIDTCPRCHEPTERELAVIAGEKLCDACIDDRLSAELKTASKRGPGETITTVVSRANGILRKYGLNADLHWCSRCQKPTASSGAMAEVVRAS